jgi:uncharacterized protein (DUF1684 family)
MMDLSEWMEYYSQEREQKELFFKEHPQSPIPFEERMDFRGLDYYPPDPGSRFELDLHEERLFIPFKDATSGRETYGAGRYLDLDYQRDRTPEGKWILDLNRAYNPWCAYSVDYVCPFVPLENWLKVPVYAGEKAYYGKKG